MQCGINLGLELVMFENFVKVFKHHSAINPKLYLPSHDYLTT